MWCVTLVFYVESTRTTKLIDLLHYTMWKLLGPLHISIACSDYHMNVMLIKVLIKPHHIIHHKIPYVLHMIYNHILTNIHNFSSDCMMWKTFHCIISWTLIIWNHNLLILEVYDFHNLQKMDVSSQHNDRNYCPTWMSLIYTP